MSPNFAKAVDGICAYVIELLERIERGENESCQNVQERLRREFEIAGTYLAQGDDWRLSGYALTCWIDEVLLEAPWDGRDWWRENVLEQELFKSRERHTQFYAKAKEAGQLPRRDSLEVFYICVILGFRGLYRDPHEAPALAAVHDLPGDLESWVRQTAMMIRQSERPRISEALDVGEGAPPLEAESRVAWSLVTGLVLLGMIAFVLILNFRG